MRGLVRLAVWVAVLWSGYWALASYGIHRGLTGWFATQTNAGWQADFAALETSGYPLTLRKRFVQPALADPATGVAWRADSLEVQSPAWWPGYVTVRFPETPQRMSYFDQSQTLVARAATADLRLAPGAQLELQELSVSAGAWALDSDAGGVMRAEDFTLSMQQGDVAEQYRLGFAATGFRPGEVPRAALRLPDSWPLEFDRFEAEALVTFDRAWDRSAIEQSRPQPREVDLRLAEAQWGDLRLFAAGSFTVDARGVPTGTVSIRADNWRDMLVLAERAGALPAGVREGAEQTLGMLAGLSGNPETLDVQLNLRGGFVAVGPLPIGPAPRIILR